MHNNVSPEQSILFNLDVAVLCSLKNAFAECLEMAIFI